MLRHLYCCCIFFRVLVDNCFNGLFVFTFFNVFGPNAGIYFCFEGTSLGGLGGGVRDFVGLGGEICELYNDGGSAIVDSIDNLFEFLPVSLFKLLEEPERLKNPSSIIISSALVLIGCKLLECKFKLD